MAEFITLMKMLGVENIFMGLFITFFFIAIKYVSDRFSQMETERKEDARQARESAERRENYLKEQLAEEKAGSARRETVILDQVKEIASSLKQLSESLERIEKDVDRINERTLKRERRDKED